ncbi:SMI1/KNR4 family protein [Hymenobacter norwichensis]|uniref:SMI1/KNR4 family protein n=1 Tax=Hymenobacter norwichensis TaxID=223903 RepID=UPI0003B46E45|nr:SMI1/KNR4 family protein [Hymenobacter norwichensis]
MTIHELLSTLKANLNQTDITLYPGASEQLIQQFEQEMALVLPADFKTFYFLQWVSLR